MVGFLDQFSCIQDHYAFPSFKLWFTTLHTNLLPYLLLAQGTILPAC